MPPIHIPPYDADDADDKNDENKSVIKPLPPEKK
jgi:hypothetical protein